jgi:hypothetical protein
MVKQELKTLKSKPEGKALVDRLQKSKNVILISDTSGENKTMPSGEPSKNGGAGLGSSINFNKDRTTGSLDVNGGREAPPFVILGHELGHADAIDKGIQSYNYGSPLPGPGYGVPIPGTTPPAEIHSLPVENKIRREHNIPERRSYYD